MPDLEALAELAHEHEHPARSSTTPSAPPATSAARSSAGADIVVESATKWIGGHGTSIGGVIVDSGKFDWARERQVPGLHRASPGYHGLVFNDVFGPKGPFGNIQFIIRARVEGLRDIGPGALAVQLVPLPAGARDALAARAAPLDNALALAQWLEDAPAGRVGELPRARGRTRTTQRAPKYLRNGFGAVLSFGIKGGSRPGKKFIDSREARLAPRQRRRREDARHPPGVDHAPAAHRGRAEERRRHARPGPRLGRASSTSTTSRRTSRRRSRREVAAARRGNPPRPET